MSAKPKSQQLAVKEAKLFKELLRDYEDRNYKKALKTAETILKKNPENGETLCMKGIVLHHMGRKQEGRDLVARGSKLDPNSHICWHVYALIWRGEQDLEKALECYLRAIKCDRDQISIVRDLVALQLQLRYWPDSLEHRIHLFQVQPKLRTNWLGLAVAYHLNKQYDNALDVLDKYEGMLVDPPKRDYDTSELFLYHATVLEEAGGAEQALAYIKFKESAITDRVGFGELKARLYLASGKPKQAADEYNNLLNEHFENHTFIKGYLQAKDCSLDASTPEDVASAVAALDELFLRIPKSLAVRRLTLQVAQGETFRKRVRDYLSDFLTKGVPSLFVDIKPLYANEEKRTIIQELVSEFKANLDQSKTLDGSESGPEAPTTRLWLLYFLAQHYSAIGQDVEALASIDQAITDTPTLPELYMMRARILKRGGDLIGAEASMNEARELDGQDRFLNCKAAKYKLRIGQTEEAEKVAGLFTRKEAPSPLSDLIDMQALWFIQEEGDAYRRKGEHALALKRYTQIDRIFREYRDDEFDFHTWCLRKATLRAYITLVRFEDQLWSHPAYLKAAQSAVDVYIQLSEKPQVNGTNGTQDPAAEEERRKAEKKAKKAQAKAKAQGAQKPAQTAALKKDEEAEDKVVDEDPLGEKLASTATPLEDALKFIRPLERMAAGRIETWLLSFEVAFRSKRYLEAIKALRTAHSIDATHPKLFAGLVRFHAAATSEPSALPETELKLYNAVKEQLFPFASIDAAKSDFLQRHASSPSHIYAVAALESGQQQVDLLFQLLRPEVAPSLEVVEASLDLLKASPRLAEFKTQAAVRFPLSNKLRDGPPVQENGPVGGAVETLEV